MNPLNYLKNFFKDLVFDNIVDPYFNYTKHLRDANALIENQPRPPGFIGPLETPVGKFAREYVAEHPDYKPDGFSDAGYKELVEKAYKNSFQHLYLSAQITIEKSSGRAKEVGNLREWWNFTGKDNKDTYRDLWNNKVGRQIGSHVKNHRAGRSDEAVRTLLQTYVHNAIVGENPDAIVSIFPRGKGGDDRIPEDIASINLQAITDVNTLLNLPLPKANWSGPVLPQLPDNEDESRSPEFPSLFETLVPSPVPLLDTNFDEAFRFDFNTFFGGGSDNSQSSGTEMEGAAASRALSNIGVEGGNWKGTSLTLNDPGVITTTLNGALFDLHQPGRDNLIQLTADQSINQIMLEAAGLGAGAPIADLIQWSKNLAEIDPLILDLDGDGIELTPFAENYIFFDIDNDDNIERTGWVGADDGILVHDINGDGVINDITETISEHYGEAEKRGTRFSSSFAALRTFDINNDGMVNAADVSAPVNSPVPVPDGNRIFLQGDRIARQLTNGVDIISIDDSDDFYVSDSGIGFAVRNGRNTWIGNNYFTGFDVREDVIDLSSIPSINSFDDHIRAAQYGPLSNRVTIITTSDGGWILLDGVTRADLTANNFIFAAAPPAPVSPDSASFANLRVWQDANSNGRTDAGELKTLSELGITSLSLSDTKDGAFIGGNEILSNSTYTTTGGATNTLASVNFIADPSGVREQTDGTGKRFILENGDRVYQAGDAGETVRLPQKNSGLAETRKYTSVIGGAGDDFLTGTREDNWLIGGPGADILKGRWGNDYIVADADDIASNQRNIHGGVGFDIVQFVGDRGVAFHLQRSQVEMVIGTDHADILTSGSSDQSIINGGGGDDVILGGSADDVLNGEEGIDTIYGYKGDDLIRGHRGADTLIGGAGEDIIQGGLGNDTISSGEHEDLLDGGKGNDHLDGGAGYDVAQYSGSYGDYAVTTNQDGSRTVRDLRVDSPDGTDTLVNVEALNFSDINEIAIDLAGPLPVKDFMRVVAQSDGRTYRIAKADLLKNDLDYQGDELSVSEVLGAVGGTVTMSGEDIMFVLDEDFNGIPYFSYKIRDEHDHPGRQVGVTGTDQKAEITAKVTLVLDHHPEDPQFLNQWYLPEVNVLPVWEDYTGEGVRVGVFEPGPWDGTDYGQIDYSHPDLFKNIDMEALRTQNPNIEPTKHATLVAGVIGAARNDIGSVGVAYGATLASEGIKNNDPDDETRNADFSALLNWHNYDIVNNSWGKNDLFINGSTDRDGNAVTNSLFEDAVRSGRNGLGSIVVFSAGNERQSGHDTNAVDLTNRRHGIIVGAINAEGDLGNLQIMHDPFSNPGASILVSAPGSNVISTSRLVENDNGSTFGDNYEAINGTSFAAPIVSGVVALMLEANSRLGWRDVQAILALSAKRINDANTTWSNNGAENWNGGGMHFSHDYGFGLVDAHAAVRLAESWQQKNVWANEEKRSYESGSLSSAIPDGSSEISHPIIVTDDIKIENVEVVFNLQHDQIGDLEIILISPDGTESILINRPDVAPDRDGSDRGHGRFDRSWLTATTNHRGEGSAGTWILKVRDKVTGQTGTLHDWELRLYGEQGNTNDTYVYTNEFASLSDGNRATLSDTSGHNIINTSAVTGDVVLDLRDGQASSIAGRTLNISSGTIIEAVYAGDGHDMLYGNSAANELHGGRGNDKLLGGVGADILDGGEGMDRALYRDSTAGVQVNLAARTAQGGYAAGDVLRNIENLTGSFIHNDTLIGDGGNNILRGLSGADTLDGGFGHDTLYGNSGNDTLNGGEGNDMLFGRKDNDTLYGGTGNDMLDGGAGSDTLTGGAGEDKYYFGLGSNQDRVIEDAATTEINEVHLSGGGINNINRLSFRRSSATPNALAIVILDAQGDKTGDILIIENFYMGDTGTRTSLGENMQFYFDNGALFEIPETVSIVQGPIDPLVFDLNNNGRADFVSLAESSINFDVNRDGIADRTAWVAAGDAILAYDENQNGLIESAAEFDFIGLEGAPTGLEGVRRSFDSNGDNVLNNQDVAWEKFGLWQDKNQNAITDEGEYQTLEQMGIQSLNLVSDLEAEVLPGKAVVFGKSEYVKADGSKGQVIDSAIPFVAGTQEGLSEAEIARQISLITQEMASANPKEIAALLTHSHRHEETQPTNLAPPDSSFG